MNRPDKQYVIVVWNDAHGSGDEVSEQSLKHYPMVYRSPGWLLRSNEEGVSLAVEWCETDGTFRGHTFIPRQMVVSEVAAHLPTQRKKKTPAST